MLEFATIPGLTKIFNRDDWMKVFLACSTLPDYRESKYSSYFITTDATIRSGKLYYEKNALDKGGYSYDPISHIALTNEKDPTLPESQDYSFGPGDKHEFHEFILAAKYEEDEDGVAKRAVTEDVLFGHENTYYYQNLELAAKYAQMTGGDTIVRGYASNGNPIVYCNCDNWQTWQNKDESGTVLTGRFTAGWYDAGMSSNTVYYRKADGTFVAYGTLPTTSSSAITAYNNFIATYGKIYVLYTDTTVVSHFFQVGDTIESAGYTIYDSNVIGDQSYEISDSIYYYKKVVTDITATTDTAFVADKAYFVMASKLTQLSCGTKAQYEADEKDYYVGLTLDEYTEKTGLKVGDEFCDRTLSFTNIDVSTLRGSSITVDQLKTYGNYLYIAKVTKSNNKTSIVSDVETTLYTIDATYGSLSKVNYLQNGYKLSNAAFGDPTDLKFRKTGTYYIKKAGTLLLEPGYEVLDKSEYTIGRTISEWETEKGIKVYMFNIGFYVADADFVGALTHGNNWYERAGTNYPYEGFVAVTTEASKNSARGALYQCKRKAYNLTEDTVHGYTGDGASAVSKSYYQYDKSDNSYTKVPSAANPVFRNTEGSSFIQTTNDTYFLKPSVRTYYADIMCQTKLVGGTKAQYEADAPLHKNYQYYYSESDKESEGMRVDAYNGSVYDRERPIYYRDYDSLGNGTWTFHEIGTRYGLTTDTAWSYKSGGSTEYKDYRYYIGSGYTFTAIPSTNFFSVVDDSLFGFQDYNDTYYGFMRLVDGTNYTAGTTTAGDIEIEDCDSALIFEEDTASKELADTPLAATDVLEVDKVYHIRNYAHVAKEKDDDDQHESTYSFYDSTERKVTDALKNVKVDDALIKTYIGSSVYGEYTEDIDLTYYTMSDPSNKSWTLKFSQFQLNFSPTETEDTLPVTGKKYYAKSETYTKSTDTQWRATKTYYQATATEPITYTQVGMTLDTASKWYNSRVYWDKLAENKYERVDRYVRTKDTTWVTNGVYLKSYFKKLSNGTFELIDRADYDTSSTTPKDHSLYQLAHCTSENVGSGGAAVSFTGMTPAALELYYADYSGQEGTPKSRSDIYELDSDTYVEYTPNPSDNPKELGLYEFTDSYYGRLVNSQASVIYRKGTNGSIPTECPVCVAYKGEEAEEASGSNLYRDGEEIPTEPSLFVESLNGESILPDEYYEECYGLYYWDQFFLDHGISCTPISGVRAYMTGNEDEPGTLFMTWTDPTIMIKDGEATATPDAWQKTTVELYDPTYSGTTNRWTLLVSTSCNAYSEVPLQLDLSDLHDITYTMDKAVVTRSGTIEDPYERLKNGYLIITAIATSGTQATYHVKASDVIWTPSDSPRLVNLQTGEFIDADMSDYQPLTGVAIPGVEYIDMTTSDTATNVYERITSIDFSSKHSLKYSKNYPVIKVVYNEDHTAITNRIPIIVGENANEGDPIVFPDADTNSVLCTLAQPDPIITIQEIVKQGLAPYMLDIGSEIDIPEPVVPVRTTSTESTSANIATVIDFDSVELVRDIELEYIHPESATGYTVADEKYYMRVATTSIESTEVSGSSKTYQYAEVYLPVGTAITTYMFVHGEVPHIQYYLRQNQSTSTLGDATFTRIDYTVGGWKDIINDTSHKLYFHNPTLSRGGYFEFEDDTRSVSFKVVKPITGTAFDEGDDESSPVRTASACWRDSTIRTYLNSNTYDKITSSAEEVSTTTTYYTYNEASNTYLAFTTTTHPEYFDGSGTTADPYTFKTDFTVTVGGLVYKDYYRFTGYMGGTSEKDTFFNMVRPVRNKMICRRINTAGKYVLTGDSVYMEGTSYYSRSGEGSELDPYVYKLLAAGTEEEVEAGTKDYVIGATIPDNSVYVIKIMPMESYTVTADSTYKADKHYYKRSGAGGYKDPYVYTKMKAGTDYEIGAAITGTVYEASSDIIIGETVEDRFWIPSLNQVGIDSIGSPDPSVWIGSVATQAENSILAGFSYDAYVRARTKYPSGVATTYGSSWWRLNPRIMPRTGTAVTYYTRTSIDYDTSKTSSDGTTFDKYIAAVTNHGGQTSVKVTDIEPKIFVYFTIA